MAWNFRSKTNAGNSGTSTTQVIAKPAGVAAGDLLVIWAAVQNGSTVFGAAPTGFSDLWADTGGGLKTHGYYRIADGSEGANFTVTVDIARRWSVLCAAWYADRATISLDIANVQATASGTNHATPTVAATQDDELVIAAFSLDDAIGASTWTCAAMNEREDFQNSASEPSISIYDTLGGNAAGNKSATGVSSATDDGVAAIACFKHGRPARKFWRAVPFVGGARPSILGPQVWAARASGLVAPDRRLIAA